jgi:hypothetical protein
VQKKYIRDRGVTEIYFLFDMLNGKDRAIDGFDMDVAITYNDGTVKNETIHYKSRIPFARSYPVSFTVEVEGRADSLEILEYRFNVLDYWGTFGSFIITTLIIYIIISVLMVVLAMAEMDGIVSIGAALLIIFCVGYTLLSPFSESIYIIIGTVIAFLPFIFFKVSDY